MMMKRAVARIIATTAPPPAAPATTATGLETAAEINKNGAKVSSHLTPMQYLYHHWWRQRSGEWCSQHHWWQ